MEGDCPAPKRANSVCLKTRRPKQNKLASQMQPPGIWFGPSAEDTGYGEEMGFEDRQTLASQLQNTVVFEIVELVWGKCELRYVKCLVQGLAHSKCLIYSSCYYCGKSEDSDGDEFFTKAACLVGSAFMRSFMCVASAPPSGHHR